MQVDQRIERLALEAKLETNVHRQEQITREVDAFGNALVATLAFVLLVLIAIGSLA